MSMRGVYLVTPDEPDTQRLLRRVGDVLVPGVALLQYRNKLASPALRQQQAQALLALCRPRKVPLLINDDVDLALSIGAEGVHLGRDDGALVSARARLAPGMLLGASCYGDWSRARAAVQAGADYVAFGAMYPSVSKPAAPVAEHALLGRASRTLGLPVACIGGITLERAPQLLAAGADLLAVISDVFEHPEPAARVRAYTALFDAV